MFKVSDTKEPNSGGGGGQGGEEEPGFGRLHVEPTDQTGPGFRAWKERETALMVGGGDRRRSQWEPRRIMSLGLETLSLRS